MSLLSAACALITPRQRASLRAASPVRVSTLDDVESETIDLALPDGAEAIPDGVICARGVCVIDDREAEVCAFDDELKEVVCEPAATPLWPKALLLGSSVLYGTNFALGRVMNDALPAAASTSARFVLAGVALLPFLFRLKPELRASALLCGCFTALGYVTQSLALVDTPAATVAFLGALTVVVCPTASWLVEKRTDLGFRDAPQVWLAAGLSLAGVACLEVDPAGGGAPFGAGDLLSVAQAVGFGTSFYLTEKMMARAPDQALPITACQVAVTALISATWACADGFAVGPFEGGWLLDDARRASATLPGLFLDPALRDVAAAAAWTGLATTAANRVAETTALGKVSSSEASVLLATEPLWAAVFGVWFVGERVGAADAVGGALICAACACAAADAQTVRRALGGGSD